MPATGKNLDKLLKQVVGSFRQRFQSGTLAYLSEEVQRVFVAQEVLRIMQAPESNSRSAGVFVELHHAALRFLALDQ